VSTTQSLAQPPTEPEHGIDAETFGTLWSGDVDGEANATNAGTLAQIAALTDVPFDAPSRAVEQWNRGDHGEYPSTDSETSIVPRGVRTVDRTNLKDAFVSIFAVQPSTHALRSPDDQPLYVDSDGQVLAVVDYRVRERGYDIVRGHDVPWRLCEDRVVAVRLLVDGDEVSRAYGTSRPTLSFTGLDAGAGTEHTFTVEALLRTTLSDDIRHPHCRHAPVSAWPDGGFASGATADDDLTTEWLAVRDSVVVTEYDATLPVSRAERPDDTDAIALNTTQPWLTATLGETTVRSRWQLYTARDPRWDRLDVLGESSRTSLASPAQPLQVYAIPSWSAPRLPTAREVGTTLVEPPTLPKNIDLPVAIEPYPSHPTVVTQASTSSHDDVSITGLVRGSNATLDLTAVEKIAVHDTALTLAVDDANAASVTLTATLRDATTDEPIRTADDVGTLSIAGRDVETNASGIATVTIPRPPGGVTARFDPAPWWTSDTAFGASTDTVYVRGTHVSLLTTLFELALPVGAFLFAAFIVDRATGLRVWPPWRGL